MPKQFNFQGPQPKIIITLNEDGTIRAEWTGVTSVIFNGMLEDAKVAFADHWRQKRLQEAMKGN